MTHFMKPKRPRTATPQTCDRCRQRPGVLLFHWIGDARPASASSDGETDWWLCGQCAALVGRDEPEGS